MSKFLRIAAAALACSLVAGAASAERIGLGREALPEEISAWDIDIRPDGMGLPEGKGTVAEGEEIWAEQCASCHGDFGEGVDRWPVIAGGFGTLTSERPVKTVGSYWPFLSTVWDYVNRAMPFTEARSLEPDQVYALVAYILYTNDIVEDEDFELSKANFLDQKMPNAGNFFMDPRPDTPVMSGSAPDPCMSDCKDEVKITGRARVLDVTPETEDPE